MSSLRSDGSYPFLKFVEDNYVRVQNSELTEAQLVELTHEKFPDVPLDEIEDVVYVVLFSANNACWSY